MSGHARSALLALPAALLACLLFAAGASALPSVPSLTVHVLATPTSFSAVDNHDCFEGEEANPREFDEAQACDQYDVLVTNSGSQPASGPIVLIDKLPAGLRVGTSQLYLARNQKTMAEGELPEGEPLGECENLGTSVKCEFSKPLQPDQRLELDLRMEVEAGAVSGARNVVEVREAGRKVATGQADDTVSPTDEAPPFGPSALLSSITGVNGSPDVQAGDHPYELTTEFDVATGMGQGPETIRRVAHSGDGGVRDVVVDLPPGLMGDAQAAPKCTLAQMQSQCPEDSIVGHIDTEPSLSIDVNSPVYNLVPERGVAAELGFLDNLNGTHVIDATLAPTPAGYVLRAVAREVPNLLLWSAITTIYGDPAAKNGGASAPGAMFTNSADCSGEPLVSSVYLDSWQHPGTLTTIAEGDQTGSVPDVEGPGAEGWASASYEAPPVTGCDELRFDPSSFSFAPEPGHAQADEPSGYESVLKVPQSETPETLATPPLKSTIVTLPPGVSISPAAADGLAACSAQQFGFTGVNPQNGIDEFTPAPAGCPEASRIGSVEVVTPLLEEHLTGSVFVAEPGCGGDGCEEAAETGGLFGLYIEIGSDARGLHVKLVGKVEVGGEGHRNGLVPDQVRTSFLETPQAPFSELRFKFNGGPRAALANPQSCGTFTTSAELEPWSAPQSGPNPQEAPSFEVSGGCGGGFAPGFEAEMTNAQAGAYGPLTTTFTRRQGEQNLAGVTVTTPEGLLGKIAAFAQCPEAQANAGTCPASSRIGTATAAAGSGSHPFYQSGPVYLTGPYKGGPFGLSIAVPAVAGPYNLGTIVTRASIHINPTTAQATIVSDPLPQSVDGVPLRLQLVNVTVGEAGNFTFNATSCAEKSVTATLTGSAGAGASVSDRYQAANCQGLKFAPEFTATTQGNGTTKGLGASLDVKLAFPQPQTAYANTAKIDTQLPLALSSRLTTLQKACTEAQFNTNPAGCPAGSFVGTVTATTPALNAPLAGPAILVSHGGRAFPDLVFLLQGENGLEIEEVGNTDIKNGITYSKFESVPDAPLTSVDVNLPEKQDSLLAAVKNLCAPTKTVTVKQKETKRVKGKLKKVTVKTTKTEPETLLMPTTLTGQNGAVLKQNIKIAVSGCPKAKKAKTKVKKKGKNTKKGGKKG